MPKRLRILYLSLGEHNLTDFAGISLIQLKKKNKFTFAKKYFH
jgi:hypothetical protein